MEWINLVGDRLGGADLRAEILQGCLFCIKFRCSFFNSNLYIVIVRSPAGEEKFLTSSEALHDRHFSSVFSVTLTGMEHIPVHFRNVF